MPASAETGFSESNEVSARRKDEIYFKIDGEVFPSWGHLYEYDGEMYFPLDEMSILLRGTYSGFDLAWNESKKRMEVKLHTETKRTRSEKELPHTIRMTRAGADLYVKGEGEKKLTVKGFLCEGLFFVRIADLGEIFGFRGEYEPDASVYRIITEAPRGVYDLDRLSAEVAPEHQFLYPTRDGYVSVVASDSSKKVFARRYTLGWRHRETIEIPYEGEFFAGFHHDDARHQNYILFANNYEYGKTKVRPPAFKLVRYGRTFVKNAEKEISDYYTEKPASSEPASMSSFEDFLVIHTSREREVRPEGRTQQSQLTLVINTDRMQIVNDTGEFQQNHVSDSLSRFAAYAEDGTLFLTDLGASSVRGIAVHVMNRRGTTLHKKAEVFKIPGKHRAKQTGTQIGGAVCTPAHLLIATNQIDYRNADSFYFDDYYIVDTKGKHRVFGDVRLFSMNRKNFKSESVQLTDGNGKYAYSVPRIVALEDGKSAVLWEKREILKDNTAHTRIVAHNVEIDDYTLLGRPMLEWVLVDESGEPISAVRRAPWHPFPKMQPIYRFGFLIWMSETDGYYRAYMLGTDGK